MRKKVYFCRAKSFCKKELRIAEIRFFLKFVLVSAVMLNMLNMLVKVSKSILIADILNMLNMLN